jgi:hypothetical protein
MPSDEMVEAAARAICACDRYPNDLDLFDRYSPDIQESFRIRARAALLAAEAVRAKTHVVVPREPTEEMRETWLNSWMGHHDHWTFGMSVTVAEGIVEEFGTAYRAMIAAGGDNG